MSLPQLTTGAAVLLVKNIVASANYYRHQLGFEHTGFFGEPPSFCILRRDGCCLMLKLANDPAHVVPHWTISPKTCNVYFWVTDADALYQEFKQRGASMDYGPCDQPYGCREFGIQDLDGYDISFGQAVRTEPDLEAIPQRTAAHQEPTADPFSISMGDFKIAMRASARRLLIVCGAGVVTLFAGLSLAMQFRDQIRSACTRLFPSNVAEIAFATMPWLPGLFVIFFGLWILEQKSKGDPRLFCPGCHQQLTRMRDLVIATRHCGHCGRQVLSPAAPVQTS